MSDQEQPQPDAEDRITRDRRMLCESEARLERIARLAALVLGCRDANCAACQQDIGTIRILAQGEDA